MTAPGAAADGIAARDESESGNRALVSSSEVTTAERRPRWSPLVVTRLRHNPHAFFAALKRDQGDVASARFGRGNLFLVSHPDDVQRVLVTDDRDFPRLNVAFKRWRRQAGREQPGVALGPGGDPDLRLTFRRELQPAYSRARIDSYWPEFLRLADETAARWLPGEPIDLVGEIEKLTLELVTRAVFGQPLDMPMDELVARTRACLALRRYASSGGYRLADRLRLRRNLKAMSAYEALAALLGRHLEQRRAGGAGGGDVLARLVAADEPRDRGDEQLVLEALCQLFVGSEPVGSAAAWTLYLLAREDETFRRVRGEVEQNRDDPDRLSYLRGVLNESIRLHPPFTLIGRQARLDVELGGQHIRAGDPVIVCPFLIHRDERWWPNPERFEPRRWLDGADAQRPRLAYLPFGAGPRQCLGAHLAIRVAEATVAAVTSRWRLVALGPAPRPTALRPSSLRMRVERP